MNSVKTANASVNRRVTDVCAATMAVTVTAVPAGHRISAPRPVFVNAFQTAKENNVAVTAVVVRVGADAKMVWSALPTAFVAVLVHVKEKVAAMMGVA